MSNGGVDPTILQYAAGLQNPGMVANPPPAPAPAPMPAPAPQPDYRPIGAPGAPFASKGYGPAGDPNMAAKQQATADAAFQASLTNGGPVGKPGAGGVALPPAAPAGPGVKAGYVPTTRSAEVSQGIRATPEMQSAQAGFEEAGRAANRAQGELAAVQPIEQKARTQEEAIIEGQLADRAIQQQKDYATELANEKWKRDKVHAAYDLAVSKGIDQHAYVKKMGTLGVIATALGAMAGGWVNAKTGAPNVALDMLNKGIEREVQAQEKAIDEKGKQAQTADTHLQMFMKEGLDKQQAAAATNVLLRQQAAKALDAKYTATSNAMGKLALAKAIQDNQKQMLDKEMEYAKLTGDTVKRKVDEKYQQASAGGVGNMREKVIKRAQELVDKKLAPDTDAARLMAEREYGLQPGSSAINAAAGGKPNPKGVAIESSLKTPAHGEDLYDRLAPDIFRSSGSLRNEAALAGQVRAYAAATGRGIPPGMSNSDIIKTFIGRPDDESVAAFQKQARDMGVDLSNAAAAGAETPAEP